MTEESRLEEMSRYVRFGGEAALELAAFAPAARPHFRRIADEFYDRVREHEDAHAALSGEAQVRRLKEALCSWLERTLAGPHDESAYQATSRIGRVHVNLGLPQRYMTLAMSLVRRSLLRLVDQTQGDRAPVVREAVCSVLDVELAVMLDAYEAATADRIAAFERHQRDTVGHAVGGRLEAYADVIEGAHIMFLGLDAQARIRLVSRELADVAGWERDELLGASFVDKLLPEALRAEQGPAIEACALGSNTCPEVLSSGLQTRAGRVRLVRWKISHCGGQGLDPVTLLIVGDDETEERESAERMRRTERLAAIGHLTSGLAHHIRNPLHGASLHVTLLERELERLPSPLPALSQAVETVGAEIQRLDALLTDFLEFVRPPLRAPQAIHVGQLCQRVAQAARPSATAAGVELVVDLPTNELIVRGDPDRIEGAILNLLLNAVQAVEGHGAGRVVLRARREPRFALIEVEDTGPGLASPAEPVFDAFYSTKPGGTGLGLSIAHRVISEHDGSIDVDSKPGSTVFSVRIPVPVDEWSSGLRKEE